MSVSEAADFAAEFAGAVGDKRRNGHRKFFMSMLELFSVLFYLHYGAITCRACIYGITKMRIVSHAQKTDASNVTWRVLHRMLIT